MTRRKLDSYLSPSWAIDELVKHVPISGRVLEPCVGEGDMALPLLARKSVTQVITNDLDPACNADYHLDAEQDEAWLRVAGRQIDWVVTNPPYGKLKPDGKPDKKADPPYEILIRALAVARVGVCFMLRLSFLEPVSTKPRGQWLHHHPPDLEVILPRYLVHQRRQHRQRHDGMDGLAQRPGRGNPKRHSHRCTKPPPTSLIREELKL